MKTVVAAGAFDTKGLDYQFLIERLLSHDVNVLTVDFGVIGDPLFQADVTSNEVARAGGGDLEDLRASNDKASAMRIMTEGLPLVLAKLRNEGRLDAVCGMGGSGGTAILTAGMRALPLGIPKLVVSTVAAGDVSNYVGSSDLTLIHSVVDVAGVNRISAQIYSYAAAAIAAMAKADPPRSTVTKPLIAASMFGNTTACVDRARSFLDSAGWEVLVFHATGSGGRTMQRLASEGLLAGLLDLTTTELADEVCGGVFSAGPERVNMGAAAAVPVVLAPGCVDMCNFGARATVPGKYNSRLLYEWNANVTLMRTNVEENRRIGALLAETANRCTGPVTVLLPLRGVSMLDSAGEPFWDPEADHACFDSLRSGLKQDIRVIEVDSNINDPVFADRAVQAFQQMNEAAGARAGRGKTTS